MEGVLKLSGFTWSKKSLQGFCLPKKLIFFESSLLSKPLRRQVLGKSTAAGGFRPSNEWRRLQARLEGLKVPRVCRTELNKGFSMHDTDPVKYIEVSCCLCSRTSCPGIFEIQWKPLSATEFKGME